MGASHFSGRMSRTETVLTLLWLPMHSLLLPILYAVLVYHGLLSFDAAKANLMVYAVSALVLVPLLWRFFRRDFDALCDHPFLVLLSVVGAYYFSLFGETLISLLLAALSLSGTSDNNEAVLEMAKNSFAPTVVISVFLAPLVEESIFRGAIFGSLRRRSRLLAYLVSILCFCLYHVWQSLLSDPRQLLYMLLYVPASFALAYVYERTDTIWSSIFLHMLSNGVAMLRVSAL